MYSAQIVLVFLGFGDSEYTSGNCVGAIPGEPQFVPYPVVKALGGNGPTFKWGSVTVRQVD